MYASILQTVIMPAYGPCPEFASACSTMRWQPEAGHVPRGFYGAVAGEEFVELVLVVAEPGDPHEGEHHSGLDSAYDHAARSFRDGRDQFHRNLRAILDSCWPNEPFENQMRKVWITESVLCSAAREGARVPAACARACGERYLLPQLRALPNALVVALGRKSRERLERLGFSEFLAVGSIAPPGCNRREVRSSWAKIPEALRFRAAVRA